MAAGLLVLAGAAPLRAEVLSISYVMPAGSDRAAAMQSIRVEPLGGLDGEALALRIEDQLRGASVDGAPYFRIFSGPGASADEGILRGTATTDLTTERYTEERERCVKDKDGACTDAKEKYKVKCQRRRFDLAVMLRLLARDGDVVWTYDSPETYRDSGCEDSSTALRNGNDIVRDLTMRVGRTVRGALAPSLRWESVRVNENRKGLTGADAARFKQAVRLTKTDPSAACAGWEGLAEGNPAHIPLLFNRALCMESQGKRDQAKMLYDQIVAIDPREPATRQGLVRLELDMLGQHQIAAHYRK